MAQVTRQRRRRREVVGEFRRSQITKTVEENDGPLKSVIVITADERVGKTHYYKRDACCVSFRRENSDSIVGFQNRICKRVRGNYSSLRELAARLSSVAILLLVNSYDLAKG